MAYRMVNLCNNRSDYYSQLNNKDDPYNACFATALVAGYDLVHDHVMTPFSKYEKDSGFTQPEDILRWYAKNDKEVQKLYKESHPGTDIEVVEWADCMVAALNGICGKGSCYFQDPVTEDDVLTQLDEGLPLAVSMKYPEHNITGHYVLIVGYEFEDGELKYIINDSYKNWLKGTDDGYMNYYTPSEFKEHHKGYGVLYNI